MYCYKVEHYNAAEDGLVIIANKTESRSSQALVWHPLDVVSGAYMEGSWKEVFMHCLKTLKLETK